MNNKALLLLVTAAIAGTAAQAQVVNEVSLVGHFKDSTGAFIPTKLVYGTDGTTKLTGQNYGAVLYTVGGDGSLSAITPVMPFRIATTASPGTWQVPAGTANPILPGAAGTEASLVVQVWDTVLFTSFANAVAGGGIAGATPTFTFKNGLSSPTGPTDINMVNFPGLTLIDYPGTTIVPEPSTIALAGLGVAGLLFFRRK